MSMLVAMNRSAAMDRITAPYLMAIATVATMAAAAGALAGTRAAGVWLSHHAH
jgi:hypothetical protein